MLDEARSIGSATPTQGASPASAPPASGAAAFKPTTPPASAPPPAPDQARQKAIDDWVRTGSDPSGGAWFSAGTSSADKIVAALHGQSVLGPMSRADQAKLIDGMMQRWDSGAGSAAGGAEELAEAAAGDPAIQGAVGERMADHAASLAAGPETYQHTAAAYGRAAVTALSGKIDGFDPDIAVAKPLQQALATMPPATAAGFARALGADAGAFQGRAQNVALARVLANSQAMPPSPATSAFVQNAFAVAGPGAYNAVPGFSQTMAHAISREWNAGNPAKLTADADRLAGLLDTDEGQALLAATPGSKLPEAARIEALAVVRTHPEITAATLQGGDPWMNPALVKPLAEAKAQAYLGRGDAPQALRGSDLPNTVGIAMGLPAAIPPGMSAPDAEAGAARGEVSYFGTGDAAHAVQPVVDEIRRVGGDGARVTVLPVTFSSGDTGPVQVPLFRVQDGTGQDRFVDNQGRRYDSFDDWKANNKLPAGQVEFPAGGHLTAGADGRPVLDGAHTPATVDTAWKAIGHFADTAALVGGVIAGGAAILGTGGLAAPAVIAAAGAWGAYRSGSALLDREQHDQSINPINDGQARGLWLSLGANALGAAAFAPAARLAALGEEGAALSPAEASLFGYLHTGANLANAAATGDTGLNLVQHWDQMSGSERAQAVLSIGFFAASSAVGARTAGTRPGDMFNPVNVRNTLLADHPPPTTADPSLPGNQVRIDYDPANGTVAAVRYGPRASPADIALHTQAAQNIQRSLALEGQLGRLIAGRGEPPPGTIGWAAKIDIAKVTQRMQSLARTAQDPAATPQQRQQAATDMSSNSQHLDELQARIGDFTRDPGDLGAIDARSTGLARAQQLGVDHLLDGHRGYSWQMGADGGLQIKASNDKLPQLALVDGQIIETKPGVTIVNGVPPINSRFAGEIMPRTELTAIGQQQYARGLAQLPAAERPAFVAGVPFSREGFPQFPSVYEARVPEADYGAGRASHFRTANKQLLASGRQGLIDRGLTGTQADAIIASVRANPSSSPSGWTWHHTEVPGKLILVPYDIHNPVKHTGGEALWGGGEP